MDIDEILTELRDLQWEAEKAKTAFNDLGASDNRVFVSQSTDSAYAELKDKLRDVRWGLASLIEAIENEE